MKRCSDVSETYGCTSGRTGDDDDDDGSRIACRVGRIRKKSAKLIEMEEFERFEKKSSTKKCDSNVKVADHLPPSTVTKKSKSNVVEDSNSISHLKPSLTMAMANEVDMVLGDVKPKQSPKSKLRDKQSSKVGSVIKSLLNSPSDPTSTLRSTISKFSSASPATSQIYVNSANSHISELQSEKHKAHSSCVLDNDCCVSQSMDVDDPEKSKLIDPAAGKLMLGSHFSVATCNSVLLTAHKKIESSIAGGDGCLKLRLMLSSNDRQKSSVIPQRPAHSRVQGKNQSTKHKSAEGGSAIFNKKALSIKKSRRLTEKRKSDEEYPETTFQELSKNVMSPEAMKKPSASKPANRKKVELMPSSIPRVIDDSASHRPHDTAVVVNRALDVGGDLTLVIAESPRSVNKSKTKKGNLPSIGMDIPNSNASNTDTLSATVECRSQISRDMKLIGKKKKSFLESMAKCKNRIAQHRNQKPSRRSPTAYMLYCNSQRNAVVADSPGIDFAHISRTLGVMWQCLSRKEKLVWRRKAKKLNGKGSTLISTGKRNKKVCQTGEPVVTSSSTPNVISASPSSKFSKIAEHPGAMDSEDNTYGSPTEDIHQSSSKAVSIEPIDIAAHLKLLGESLNIIGNRLQDHKGLSAVQGSFSVLLDSMLCACAPLMALTRQVPGLDGCSECTHALTLDSIAYIMPGL